MDRLEGETEPESRRQAFHGRELRTAFDENPHRRAGARRHRGGHRGQQQAHSVRALAAASNLLNNVNPTGYSGVMTSPFFGQPTSAAAARNIDIGMKIEF
jgi:hypothetical protein